MHRIQVLFSESSIKRSRRLVLWLLVSLTPLCLLAVENEVPFDLGPYGDLVFISNLNGLDAIVVYSGRNQNIVFSCELESELILTPSISPWDTSLTFLVDQGAAGRTIHSLALKQTGGGAWTGVDVTIASIPGAAWPVRARDGSFFVVMPDARNLNSGKVTGIFHLHEGSFSVISGAEDKFRHFWPLLSRDGKQLVFRQLVIPEGEGSSEFWSRTLVWNMENDTRQVHFVNEQIYLEQWLPQGILISTKLEDEARTRIYKVYDPVSRESTEIYRGGAWQARVTDDLQTVASIRPEPVGGSLFDIFITVPVTGVEVNLTGTPRISESLIGWLP